MSWALCFWILGFALLAIWSGSYVRVYWRGKFYEWRGPLYDGEDDG